MVIYSILSFFEEELNKYLSSKIDFPSELPVMIGNVSKVLEDTNVTKRIILSLINVEEDRVLKQQENIEKTVSGIVYRNPPIFLNLYILFVIKGTSDEDYKDCLIWLGYIIQFFQFQKVFTPLTHPDLDSSIQKLIVDLHSTSFEQVNHLWSVLGGKYYPSVLYKVRQITINEEATLGESGFIKN